MAFFERENLMNQHIPIFLASDKNYAPLVATTMASILDHTHSFVDFYILDSGITLKQKQKINLLFSKFKNFSIEYLIIDSNKYFANAKVRSYYTQAMYNRFLIPLLKPELKKAIYSDVDVIFNDDIQKFFDIPMQGYGLAAPIEELLPPLQGSDNHFFRKNLFGIPQTHTYFQSGNLLIDCEYWRQNKIMEKLFDVMQKYADKVKYPDLDVLNIVFANNYKKLDYHYSYCTNRLDVHLEQKPFLYHYASANKPWNCGSVAYKKIFWHYAQKTPFYHQLRLKYCYHILKWHKETIQNIKRIKFLNITLFKKNKLSKEVFLLGLPITKISRKIQLKKRLLKLIVFPIPHKQTRHKLRDALDNFSVLYFYRFFKFCFHKIKPKTVLLLELNDVHGVTAIGYTKYLLDLGYHVDVLMSAKNLKEKPFWCLKSKKLSVFAFHLSFVRFLLQSKKIKKYEFVFINTSRYFIPTDYSKFLSVKDKLGFWPMGKKKTLIVEHDISDIEIFNLTDYEKNKQIITLGSFSKGVVVNAHYFGISKKYDSDYPRFVVVGNINPQQRGYNLLIDAVDKLYQKGLHCQIVVVGSGSLKNIPKHLVSYFSIRGHLSFPEMIKAINKSDFLLTLLDPNNPAHDRYITTGITGSSLLAYGLDIPPLVHKKFADFYGFCKDNAVVYEDDLSQAMIDAFTMSQDRYNMLCQNLHQLAKQIETTSLQNLKEMIK